jgi:hypothetical protein
MSSVIFLKLAISAVLKFERSPLLSSAMINGNVRSKIRCHDPISSALAFAAPGEPDLSDAARSPDFIALKWIGRDGIDDRDALILRKPCCPGIANELRQFRHGVTNRGRHGLHYANGVYKSMAYKKSQGRGYPSHSPGALAWIASACTPAASSLESVWLTMRWRSIRLFPRNASDTI